MKSSKIITTVVLASTFLISTCINTIPAKAYDEKPKETISKQTKDPKVEKDNNKAMANYIVKVTSTSGAKIRSGPGTNFGVVGTANYGANLRYQQDSTFDSEGYGWFKVLAPNGKIGWIRDDVSEIL